MCKYKCLGLPKIANYIVIQIYVITNMIINMYTQQDIDHTWEKDDLYKLHSVFFSRT